MRRRTTNASPGLMRPLLAPGGHPDEVPHAHPFDPVARSGKSGTLQNPRWPAKRSGLQKSCRGKWFYRKNYCRDRSRLCIYPRNDQKASSRCRFGSKADICNAKRHAALLPQADIERIKLDVSYGPIATCAKFVPTFLHGPASGNCLTEITVRNLDFARERGSNCKNRESNVKRKATWMPRDHFSSSGCKSLAPSGTQRSVPSGGLCG